ncbi:MAG: hypothetical protein HZB53_14165 [Chloroflexi bacterium]|nr:hypothetical protein [Chloroflexota bacterium]
MSVQELAGVIKHLTLDERLHLLNMLTQSIRDDLQPTARATDTPLRLRGLLRPDGPLPTDAALDDLRVQSLLEKHA